MRLLAIGDIHGCLLQFNDLLKLVQPTSEDRLILLGDYVDRGPDSRGVLDRILELQRTLPNLICLRGNHEILMLDSRDQPANQKMWLSVGGLQTLGSYGTASGRAGKHADVPQEHWDFLASGLLPYYETEEHIFVHAGVNYNDPLDEQDDGSLYWEFLRGEMRHHSGKTVVCGHTAQKSGEVKVIPGAVCIDTYAHGGGWLTCLDALSGRFWQVNFLGKPRQGIVEL
ncbi:MAG TPA: metallophosphoesterase family protein [Urbifossiella sp.]|nr:metallophosphoesterase family protein [Urbifossiella sp.]